MMKIGIIGLGAVGLGIAEQLQNAGFLPIGFSRRGQSCFEIHEQKSPRHSRLRILQLPVLTCPARQDSFDLLIFATKVQDLKQAFTDYAPMLKPEGVVLCAQNGLPEHLLAEWIAPQRILGALVKCGAEFQRPNRLILSQPVQLTLGSYSRDCTPQASEILRTLGKLPFCKVVEPTIMPHKWLKMAFSCAVNSMSAITGLSADVLFRTPAAFPYLSRILHETVAIATAEGIALPKEGPLDIRWVFKYPRVFLPLYSLFLRNVRVSMLQDVLAGRPTEIEFLNGHLIRRAKELGLETPCNELACILVHAIERRNLRPSIHNLQGMSTGVFACEPFLYDCGTLP